MERSGKKDILVTVAVLVVIVFIVAGVVIANKDKSTGNAKTTNVPAATTTPVNTATDSTTTSPATTDTTAVPSTSSEFKDGSYTASADYSTPEDDENITLNVTVKDGVITDTSATVSANSRESKEYSNKFVQNYKSQVVGKALANISLSRVSGSSLTSQGFNDAIKQIRTQAKS